MSVRETSASNPASHSLARKLAREVRIHGQAYLAIRRARRATHGRTVIVGPWSSEVGFELLYWIPFVRQRLRERGMTPDRVVVVSRGGVSAWYGEIAARYFDLLDWFPAERLLEERRERIRVGGGEKQMSITPFDREVLTRVRDEIGDPGARLLHPLTMYRRYRGVWTWRRPPAVVEREVDFSPIAAPPAPPAGLAEGEYIALKAYFSSSFPATPENRHALNELIGRLADHGPVVLLGNGGAIDDHEHPEFSSLELVRAAVPPGPPHTNLARQTGIVRGARLLAATYGGFSYLGPFIGVPTCAFHSHDVFNPVHLEVLRRAERALQAGSGERLTPAGYFEFGVLDLPLIDQLASEPSGVSVS